MFLKNIHLIIMLAAGVITCVMAIIQEYSYPITIKTLGVVLFIFYIIGLVVRAVIEHILKNRQVIGNKNEENTRVDL